MDIILMVLGGIGSIWYLVWLFPMLLADWTGDSNV